MRTRTGTGPERTRRAISELRRISGLTWHQPGQLLGMSRRSVHYWASGKPLNAGNQERLTRVFSTLGRPFRTTFSRYCRPRYR